jgi:hypothetical protein
MRHAKIRGGEKRCQEINELRREVLAVGRSNARSRSNCDTHGPQPSVKAHGYPRKRVQPCRGVTAPIGLMGKTPININTGLMP